MTFDDVREFALAWPEVEDSTSYGTPALRIRKKLLVRLKEDGDTLVMPVAINLLPGISAATSRIKYVVQSFSPYQSRCGPSAGISPRAMLRSVMPVASSGHSGALPAHRLVIASMKTGPDPARQRVAAA